MIAKGSFTLITHAEPPYDVVLGVSLGRMRFEKRFVGELEATSEVHMIGVRTPVDGSAGYVAIERVTGRLHGKKGTFVLQHSGTMDRGEKSLTVTVVPSSGTEDLEGLRGGLEIRVEAGDHFYELDYEL